MIDFGFDKMALIGAVALIVIGPEKLPRVARTVGTLLGKAQRYVADVKAEVNRSIELEELQKMKIAVRGRRRATCTTRCTSEFNETRAPIAGDMSALGDAADPPVMTPRVERPTCTDARSIVAGLQAAEEELAPEARAPCRPGTSSATACARTRSRAPRAWRASARAAAAGARFERDRAPAVLLFRIR